MERGDKITVASEDESKAARVSLQGAAAQAYIDWTWAVYYDVVCADDSAEADAWHVYALSPTATCARVLRVSPEPKPWSWVAPT